jgi:hypothetical protein
MFCISHFDRLTDLLRHSQEQIMCTGTIKNVGYCIPPYRHTCLGVELKDWRYKVRDCLTGLTSLGRLLV